jgi:hypothetical protein
MKRFQLNTLVAGIALFTLVLAGCSKEESRVYNRKGQTSVAEARSMFTSIMNRLPTIGFYDEKSDNVIILDKTRREFSFATPNSGWNFSNSTGVQYVTDGSTGIIFIPFSSIGGNSGGTVVAGSTTLDVNYAFCFAASDEALGLDVVDFGGDFTGVSAVFGIAGNFSAIDDNGFDDVDLDSFFQGMAMYIVYDNEAQGSYDVLNWLEDIEEGEQTISNKAFSWVLDFQQFNMYLSNSGSLSVSGGEMDFSGDYLGFLELFESLDDDDDLQFAVVSGFGAMGCN